MPNLIMGGDVGCSAGPEQSWRHRSVTVAVQRRLPRLVQCDPQPHPVPELCEAQPGVLLEPVRRGGVQPAALLLQRLRQVPVVQRHCRLYTNKQSKQMLSSIVANTKEEAGKVKFVFVKFDCYGPILLANK